MYEGTAWYFCLEANIKEKKEPWNVRFSNMYSATGFMQNALAVLHNALRLPSLRNANHLKLMESIQVDGILPRARLWNICDSSNVIDAAKARDRQIQVGRRRGRKERGHEKGKWVWSLPCRIWHQLLLTFLHAVIKQAMKDVVYRRVYTFKRAQRSHFAGRHQINVGYYSHVR